MEIPIDQLKSLVELMVTHDLSRVELREGEALILLRRGQPVVTSAPAAATLAPLGANGAPAAPPAAAIVESKTADANEILIRSPMVGTFYAAPDPESPAFVSIGDNVRADTVVCLVEAMKVFNEIRAETQGRVVRVLAKSGEAVEFDQPLFAVASA
ncbi:MAG: acetyl-CoA carboxylase biotin carboxyl carrier protein [Phycisphaerae bacterium]